MPPGATSGHGSRHVTGSPGAPSESMGSPTTAQSALSSATSTRSVNLIRSSHAASAGASKPSVTNHVFSPSSTTPAACSTWPFGLSTRVSVEVCGGSSDRSWEVIELSQVSRSGPLTRTTP